MLENRIVLPICMSIIMATFNDVELPYFFPCRAARGSIKLLGFEMAMQDGL